MEACKAVLKGLVDDDSEIVTLIYGEDVTSEEAEAVTDFIENELEIDMKFMTENNLFIHSLLVLNKA